MNCHVMIMTKNVNLIFGKHSIEQIELDELKDIEIEFSRRAENHTLHGLSNLHLAVLRNKYYAAQLILRNKALVDAKDDECNTPLHYAAYSGNIKMTKLLLRYGCDVNAISFRNMEPILYAINNNYVEVVGILLNAGAYVRKLRNRKLFKLYLKYRRIIRQLIRKGIVKIDLKNSKKEGLLMSAIYEKDMSTAKFLINRGATISYKEVHYIFKDPVIFGNYEFNSDFATLLVNAGANFSIPNAGSQCTLLHWVAQRLNAYFTKDIADNFFIHRIPELLDGKHKNFGGKHTLRFVNKKRQRVLKKTLIFLLRNGADINALDKRGLTPIQKICSNMPNSLEMIFLKHIAKLIADDRHVSKNTLAKIWQNSDMFLFLVICLLQLNDMRHIYNKNYISWFNVLVKKDRKELYNFVNYFSKSDMSKLIYDKRLVMYREDLVSLIGHSMAHIIISKDAFEKLQRVTKQHLPIIIKQSIFKYLDICDVINFLIA